MQHICSYIISYAAYAAASPGKFFEAKLIRFGKIWLDLGKFEQNLCEI